MGGRVAGKFAFSNGGYKDGGNIFIYINQCLLLIKMKMCLLTIFLSNKQAAVRTQA